MDERAIYIFVLVVYMGLLAAVGILTSRRLKSAEDFHIGGRRIGPWVTALSYVAAYFSSVLIIGGGGFGYQYGMATLWIGAVNVLVGCALAWIVLGKRVREFTSRLGTMSVPGFLAERFRAKEARILSAVVVSVFLIIYNVSVLQGMGRAFEVLMGIPYTYGVLLSGLIIIAYVSLGGYLAVVWTGFFQAWVMGVGLILLAVAALQAVGGLTAANVALAAVDPGLVETPGVWGWPGLVSYSLIVSFGAWGMPQLVVRFYSIKSVSALRVGAVVATIGGAMALLPYLTGAIARVLHPGLANPDLAIPTLTQYCPFAVGCGDLPCGRDRGGDVHLLLGSDHRLDGRRAGLLPEGLGQAALGGARGSLQPVEQRGRGTRLASHRPTPARDDPRPCGLRLGRDRFDVSLADPLRNLLEGRDPRGRAGLDGRGPHDLPGLDGPSLAVRCPRVHSGDRGRVHSHRRLEPPHAEASERAPRARVG